MTNGRKLDIDMLVGAINRQGTIAVAFALPILKEAFPEILWTRGHDGRLDAMVNGGYRS
jgi:hypothetical protein